MDDLTHSLQVVDLIRRLQGREHVSLLEASRGGGAAWLAAVPLEEAGYAFPRQTFRDAVAVRMGIPLPDPLPPACPSCGEEDAEFSHSLKCHTGGWVRRRHTDVLKEWARLMKMLCETVVEEPELGPVIGLCPRRN
jgi:hypothetical protein